jgi:hypothetical protein
MNATYSMDDLHAVTHVTSLLNTSTNANMKMASVKASTPSISKPKLANTSHYDPTGQEVATVSNTSYDGVTFAPDGSIASGNLSHESLTLDGTRLSTTSVGFQNGGKPASAEINVHNHNGIGDFKKVVMDMNGVTWSDSFSISSGQVKLSTIDAATQLKKNDGAIQFEKEMLVSGSFTHFSLDKAGEISHYSEVDYTTAKFLGTRIIGGQYAIKSLRPDKSLASNSLVSVSSLGRVQNIETTNHDASSSIKSKVLVDFSKVNFNARNRFDSGDINYTVNDDKGTLLSKTTVTYKDAFPASSQTLVYNKAVLVFKILVDYSQSKFNNSKQVVNSSKKVEIYSKDDKMISSTIITYDEQGKKIPNKTVNPPAPSPAPPPKKSPLANLPSVPQIKPVGANQTERKDPKYRADGSLEQMRVIVQEGDKPISSTITYYGTDGTTVIKTHTLDLTGITYDQTANSVTGTLNMATHLGGTILHAASSIQY